MIIFRQDSPRACARPQPETHKKAPRGVPCYNAKLAPFLDLNEAGLPRVYLESDTIDSKRKSESKNKETVLF